MKTYVVNGVENVEVLATAAARKAIKALSGELSGHNHVCGLCPNFPEFGINCCPTHNYLVRADVWPILKMRLPPGALQEEA